MAHLSPVSFLIRVTVLEITKLTLSRQVGSERVFCYTKQCGRLTFFSVNLMYPQLPQCGSRWSRTRSITLEARYATRRLSAKLVRLTSIAFLTCYSSVDGDPSPLSFAQSIHGTYANFVFRSLLQTFKTCGSLWGRKGFWLCYFPSPL